MKAVVIAVAAVLGAATPAAFAQDYYRGDRPYYGDTARVIESRPVYESTEAKQECWNPRAGHYEEVRGEEKTRVGAGAAIGAIAGGVLGHQVGSGRGNTAATVAGAIGGGLLGHQVEKRRSEDGPQDDLDRSKCRVIGGTGALQGYEVRYEYGGREYVTKMNRDPGRRLRVGRDINSDGTPLG